MKIAIIGYGKMGKAIENIALNRGHEVVFRAFSDSIKTIGKNYYSVRGKKLDKIIFLVSFS